jgi:polysaccharide export outer membrane protein
MSLRPPKTLARQEEAALGDFLALESRWSGRHRHPDFPTGRNTMSSFRLFLHGLGAVLLLAGSAAGGQNPAPARPSSGAVGGAPASGSISIGTDFVIGPEDVLGILFWREADFSGDFAVRPDGRITLPLIGDIVAAGIAPSALKEQIQAAAAKYLTEPNVTVVVRQINSRKVFITGEVARPGSYPLTGPRTVMQLISLAGGLTEFAKTDGISILRQEEGRTRAFTFNYKDVAQGRSVHQNIQLQPGDTIVVPE